MDKTPLDLPEFLTKPGKIEKFDENSRHREKLKELVLGTDEDDAAYICELFAEKYPDLMFTALRDRLEMLTHLSNRAKEIYNSLGGLE